MPTKQQIARLIIATGHLASRILETSFRFADFVEKHWKLISTYANMLLLLIISFLVDSPFLTFATILFGLSTLFIHFICLYQWAVSAEVNGPGCKDDCGEVSPDYQETQT